MAQKKQGSPATIILLIILILVVIAVIWWYQSRPETGETLSERGPAEVGPRPEVLPEGGPPVVGSAGGRVAEEGQEPAEEPMEEETE